MSHTKTCMMLTFVRNRGELAEGWYDPATSKKANDDVRTSSPAPEAQPPASQEQADSRHFLEDSSEDDGLGPALPGGEVVGHTTTNASRLGPTVPSLQDLELKRGTSPSTHYWHICFNKRKELSPSY